MAGVKFTNKGSRPVAIPFHGGTETIGVDKSATVDVRDGWLTDDRSEALKKAGVTFEDTSSEKPSPKKSEKPSPKKSEKPAPKKSAKNDGIDDLKSQAEELGIQVDDSWDATTLQGEIDKALDA